MFDGGGGNPSSGGGGSGINGTSNGDGNGGSSSSSGPSSTAVGTASSAVGAAAIARGTPVSGAGGWAPMRLALMGHVVRGFGRGSKLLNMPTANLELGDNSTRAAVDALPPGIYFGWGRLGRHAYKMVCSVGFNPVFANRCKTLEPHLLHRFEADFYGATLRLCVVGFIRPELDFPSLAALCAAMKDDCEWASTRLDSAEARAVLADPFLTGSDAAGADAASAGCSGCHSDGDDGGFELVITDYKYEPPTSFEQLPPPVAETIDKPDS
ncbi:unnamed protein product [Phaeothamnion confervicola]